MMPWLRRGSRASREAVREGRRDLRNGSGGSSVAKFQIEALPRPHGPGEDRCGLRSHRLPAGQGERDRRRPRRGRRRSPAGRRHRVARRWRGDRRHHDRRLLDAHRQWLFARPTAVRLSPSSPGGAAPSPVQPRTSALRLSRPLWPRTATSQPDLMAARYGARSMFTHRSAATERGGQGGAAQSTTQCAYELCRGQVIGFKSAGAGSGSGDCAEQRLARGGYR
jgi:hypothetical protein